MNQIPNIKVEKIVNLVCSLRHGSMDDKQFKATLEHNLSSLEQSLHQELHKARAEGFNEGMAAVRCKTVDEARHDWLREEIVKLEGSKQDLSTYKTGGEIYKFLQGNNHALQIIIDRYHSELDQDKKVCCRWCCSEKHEHIQCTDSSRCHCPCHTAELDQDNK